MASQRSPSFRVTSVRSRREFLAAAGAVAVGATAGCSARGPYDERSGEGDTIEIIVGNGTDEPATIAVYIADDSGESLFSRVYDLEPGHGDESAGIETPPATITAFTPDGVTATWAYDPDLDIDCEGEDIGITLTRERDFRRYYTC